MSSKAKHAQRSKKSYRSNPIPANMFYRNAVKKAQSKLMRLLTLAKPVEDK